MTANGLPGKSHESASQNAASTASELRSYADQLPVVLSVPNLARKLREAADEIDEYEACANLMLDALLLVRDESGKQLGVGDAIADHGWCAGVAMSAIAALGERVEAWKRRHSPIPKFLPTWLGGEADEVSGPGAKL